jgi:NAD(P)-dependent dehydrogenase (short-subunit alcohol dehydrogenase family)
MRLRRTSPPRTVPASLPGKRAVIGDRLDILVANAGVSKAATIEETTVEDFDKLFAVNVRAPFFLVQQLLPIMSRGSASFSSRRSRRAPSLARFQRMQQPRVPSILW